MKLKVFLTSKALYTTGQWLLGPSFKANKPGEKSLNKRADLAAQSWLKRQRLFAGETSSLPPPGPTGSPPRAWLFSGCRAQWVSPPLLEWGQHGPVWRAGLEGKTQQWLCSLHIAWWGSPSQPATTGKREGVGYKESMPGHVCSIAGRQWGCTWVDSSCPGGSSCWCVSVSTSLAEHCYRCTVMLPRRAQDVGGTQPFTKTTARPHVIRMLSHTVGTIRSGVGSWLYSLLPVILCASFFSATYTGRMLPPRFPGRI